MRSQMSRNLQAWEWNAWEGLGMGCLGGLGNGMLGRVTEAKKEAGPDEFL